MTAAPDADSFLMAAAARGDEAAFAKLVERHRDMLLNFFLRQGVDKFDGEDLAQQTFLRLWNYRGKYEPSAKFTTFLFLIARQVRVDAIRKDVRRHRLEQELEREAQISPPSAASFNGDDVRGAVAKLTQPLRDVVELAIFRDLPYAEISGILGIPCGTVKSRMFNALKKLKEFLS